MSHLNDLLVEYDVYRKGMREDDGINMDDEDEFEFDLDASDDDEPDMGMDDEPDMGMDDEPDMDLDDDDDGELDALDFDDEEEDEEEFDDESESLEDRIDDLESKLTQVLSQMAAVVADKMDTDDDIDGEIIPNDGGDDDDMDMDDDDMDMDDDDMDMDDPDDMDMGDEEVTEYEDRLPPAGDMDDSDFEADGKFDIKPYGAINRKRLARRRGRYAKHRYTEEADPTDDDGEDIYGFLQAIYALGGQKCDTPIKLKITDYDSRKKIDKLLVRYAELKGGELDKDELLEDAFFFCITGEAASKAKELERMWRNSDKL
jgi:hypothetical protein